jgi:hypothetical protein
MRADRHGLYQRQRTGTTKRSSFWQTAKRSNENKDRRTMTQQLPSIGDRVKVIITPEMKQRNLACRYGHVIEADSKYATVKFNDFAAPVSFECLEVQKEFASEPTAAMKPTE